MAKKYTYSRTFGIHTFTANEFDSFDEAVKAVEKGIYDFQLANPERDLVSEMVGSVPVGPREINEADLEVKVADDVDIEEKIN